MKQAIQNLLSQFSPELLENLRAINHRRLFGKRFGQFQDELSRKLYPSGDIQVRSGPFAGMKYFNEIVWGTTAQKWLGSYEIELAPTVEAICREPYQVILDVGCAEGYFAIGFAMRMPSTPVYGFDTDFLSRKQAQKLARLNKVGERVTIEKFCSHADVERLHQERSLIFCDIEGSERELLDPSACPALTGYDILVELHDTEGKPPLGALFTERFGSTHEIAVIASQSRRDWIEEHAAQFPALDEKTLAEAVDEHRVRGQSWLWMKRR